MKTLKPPETQDLHVANQPHWVRGMKVRAHIFVNGRVQGVFFRSQTQRKAESLDVKAGFATYLTEEWKQSSKAAKNR